MLQSFEFQEDPNGVVERYALLGEICFRLAITALERQIPE